MISQDLPGRYIKLEVLKSYTRKKWPEYSDLIVYEEVDSQYWRVEIPWNLTEEEIKQMQIASLG